MVIPLDIEVLDWLPEQPLPVLLEPAKRCHGILGLELVDDTIGLPVYDPEVDLLRVHIVLELSTHFLQAKRIYALENDRRAHREEDRIDLLYSRHLSSPLSRRERLD